MKRLKAEEVEMKMLTESPLVTPLTSADLGTLLVLQTVSNVNHTQSSSVFSVRHSSTTAFIFGMTLYENKPLLLTFQKRRLSIDASRTAKCYRGDKDVQTDSEVGGCHMVMARGFDHIRNLDRNNEQHE